MSMKKISEIQLETTANYQPLSKLNVRLWNQDKGVSVLKFLVTRDNFPLSLSSENVKMIIVIENGDNFISSEDFEISSEVDGVASFQIPDDFMAAATGECVAQVYVGTLDNDEVVVYRQITFEISQDLLSSIPSELKLQYIKTFSDLSDSISTRLLQIEEDMATMEDYVVAVNQATTDGLNALNNLVNAKTVEYNDNHADKLALINNTVDGYVQDFLDQRSYIDTKYAEFQTAVGGSGLVTDVDAESWQKAKLTEDDGTLGRVTNIDLNNPESLLTKTCFIYVDATINQPPTVHVNGYLFFYKRTDDYIKMEYIPYNSDRVFHRTKSMGVWGDWVEVAMVDSNNPFETTQESQNKANVAENNAKVYADDKVNATRAVLFSGSVNGVGQKIDLTESMDNYSILIVSGSYPGGNFDEVIVVSNIGTGHPIQRVNLSNPTATGAVIYETELTKDSNTRFNIIRDNYYGIASGEATMNSNSFTIKKIEAIK